MSTLADQEERPPLLVVPLRDTGHELKFYSRDEILTWINDEISVWNPIVTGRFHEPRVRSAISTQGEFTKQLERLSKIVESGTGSIELPSQNKKFVSVREFRGQVISRLAGSNIEAAQLALAITFDASFELNLGNRTHQQAAVAMSTVDTLEAGKHIIMDLAAQTDAANQRASSIEVQLQGQLQENKATMDGLIQKALLESPTQFWSARDKRKRDDARVAWWAWYVGCALGIFAILFAGFEIFTYSLPSLSISTNYPELALLPRAVVLGTVIGFLIWILRQMLRTALSLQHLAEDAAERVTMVQTYSAMKAKGLAAEDLSPILNALFRPAATGFVADDGPVTPLEVITRQLGNRAGGNGD